MGKTLRRWKVAAIQMTSTTDRQANLKRAESLARRGAETGAKLIALPENFSYLRREGTRPPAPEDLAGALTSWLRELAADLGCFVLAGSLPERIQQASKIHNTSVLAGPEGEVVAVYRKMHLFDVRMRGKAVFEESRFVVPGDRPVVATTSLGKLGLTICYDLRFPELYRRLALEGAQVVLVPSAFTAYTGAHHWMPLLRARAIENQCWIVAPAQVGFHSPTRQSHGHTAVVDPWGTVVALRERGEGVVVAEIDLDQVDRVREGLPCLEHVHLELLGKGRAGRVHPQRKLRGLKA